MPQALGVAQYPGGQCEAADSGHQGDQRARVYLCPTDNGYSGAEQAYCQARYGGPPHPRTPPLGGAG